MNFFYFIFSSSLAYNFLQLEQTSKSTLSEGLKTYSDELSSFGDNLSQSLQSLDQSINSKIDHTTTVASSILNNRINELENEKSKLDYEIETLNKKLKLLSSSCETFSRCVDCLTDPTCVWCAEVGCVAGDSEGPYQNECNDYKYSSCPDQSCEDYLTCNSCTAESCGWCDSTRVCFDGTARNSGSCDKQFYYHEGYKTCYQESDKSGEMQEEDVYKAKNPTNSVDPVVEDIEEKLQKDYKRYAEIEEEIDIDLYQIEVIEGNAEEVKEVKVEEIDVESVESIESELISMEEDEIEEAHQYQDQLLKDAGQTVIDYTDQVMEDKTQEVIEAIQNLTAYYEAILAQMEEDYQKSSDTSNSTSSTSSTTSTSSTS